VYNRWNPYFYLVHRAMAPIRRLYWDWSTGILDAVYPVAKLLFQPLAYLVMGDFLDERTGKAMFMDQVMVPYARLFGKSALRRYAEQCGCTVGQFAYSGGYMMLTAVFNLGK